MRKIVFALGLGVLCGSFSALLGADLTLRNGEVYRDYSIESIKPNQITISFLQNDGSIGLKGISLQDLPDDVATQVQAILDKHPVAAPNPATPATSVAVDFPSALNSLANELQTQLAPLSEEQQSTRKTIIAQFRTRIAALTMQYATTADFTVAKQPGTGSVLRVTATPQGSRLKSNHYLFAYGNLPGVGSDLHLQLFPTGGAITLDGFGTLPIYATTFAEALQLNLNGVAMLSGDAAMFSVVQTEIPATPVVQNIYIDNSSQVVQNDEDDDEDDNWMFYYWYYRNKRPRPPHPGPVPPVPPAPKPEPQPKPQRPSNGHTSLWPLPDKLLPGK